MNAISKKSLLIIATSGALVLSAFARGHVQIIRGGSSFNPVVITPGAGTAGPTTPGVTIPGQGTVGTNRSPVGGLPGLNGPGTMTPGTGQPAGIAPVPSLPSLIGH